jgi:hypothetical protein
MTCQCAASAFELGSAVTVVDRTAFRGDSLFFLDHAYKDVTTGALFSVPAGLLPPPNAVPLDLAGARMVFTAKSYDTQFDQQAIWQLDNAALGGVVVTSAAGGAFTVTAPPIRTYAFADGPVELVFDLQVVLASGRVATIEAGTITIVPDVTRIIA